MLKWLCMKKYLEFFKASFKWSLENRLATIVWVFVGIFPVFLMFLIWDSLYNQGGSIGSFSKEKLISYYFSAGLINMMVASYRSTEIPNRIKDGDLALDLLRPYSFIKQQFFDELGYKSLHFIVSFPSFFLFFFFAGETIDLNISLNTIFPLLFFALAAYILNFLLDFTFSLVAFYTETAWWIFHIKMVSLYIFGGLAFPLSMFPEKIKNILFFLPHQYLVYYPSQIISGGEPSADYIKPAFIVIFWLIVLLTLCRILWGNGIKRFSAVGR